jgi:hypothetical protein
MELGKQFNIHHRPFPIRTERGCGFLGEIEQIINDAVYA